MISVVIPLYNKEKQIEKTLQSVLLQSFQNFEIVIVNDGSTDGSEAAAESVQDERIRIIHQENAGVSAARNRGIAEAKFDLIAFLDADDRWKPEYLQTQFELMQKYPECSVFACNYEFVHADGSVHPTIIRKLPFAGQDGILANYFEVASCSNPPLWTSAVMARKTPMQAIGGFPTGIKSGEDLLTWARLASVGIIAYSRKVGAQYELQTSSSGAPPSDIERTDDAVSVGLARLITLVQSEKEKTEISKYLAFWYKMRSRINLTLGNRVAAIKCALASLKLQWSLRCCVLIVLSVCPKSLIKNIFSARL